MTRNLWDFRITLDELQDRVGYDRNLQDVAQDLTDQIEALREILRHRWDTLVIDAWAFARRNKKAQAHHVIRFYYGEPGWVWEVMLQEHGAKSLRFEGQTSAHDSDADAARHAAALASWPTLSAEDRARIGECP